MKYQIVEIKNLSGNQSKIYSIIPNNEEYTLFENFVIEYKVQFKDEIKDIYKRLKTIGHSTGARESFFKLKEGKPGDLVCALYDMPEKNLRLYCIRYSSFVIILGGGGEKSNETRAWQDNEKLTLEATKMMDYSNHIYQRIKDQDLYWSPDGKELEGNLNNTDDE